MLHTIVVGDRNEHISEHNKRLKLLLKQDTSSCVSLSELVWGPITCPLPHYHGLNAYYDSERIKRGNVSDKPIQILPLWLIDELINEYPCVPCLQDSEVILYGLTNRTFMENLIKAIQWVVDNGVKLMHIAIVEYDGDMIDWVAFIPKFNALKEDLAQTHDSYSSMIEKIKEFFDVPIQSYISYKVTSSIEHIDVHVFDFMNGTLKI